MTATFETIASPQYRQELKKPSRSGYPLESQHSLTINDTHTGFESECEKNGANSKSRRVRLRASHIWRYTVEKSGTERGT